MASAFGYLIYLVRANPQSRGRELYRVNAVGEEEPTDLYEYCRDTLVGMGSGYHSDSAVSEGYKIAECAPFGRCVWLRVNKGPVGVAGEVHDLDNGTSTPTTSRQALLSGLRALLILPADAYFGLLFVERVGRRSIKDVLAARVTDPASMDTRSIVRLEAFAEAGAWETELAGKTALVISKTSAIRQTGEDLSTRQDTLVTTAMRGGAVHRVSSAVKEALTSRVGNREKRLDVLVERSQLAEKKREAAKSAKARGVKQPGARDGFTVQDAEELSRLYRRISELDDGAAEMSPIIDDLMSPISPTGDDVAHRGYDVQMGGAN